MSESRPPGWYPDPFGTSADDRRYWDGDTWLAVEPAPAAEVEAPTAPSTDAPWANAAALGDAIDGDLRLATWGQRVAATLIDWLLLAAVGFVLLWVVGLGQALTELAETSAEISASNPTAAEFDEAVQQASLAFATEHGGTLLTFFIVQTLLAGAYSVVLTALRGQTLGKRALGIKVRRLDDDSLPMWREALVRWLVQTLLPTIVTNVPLIAIFGVGFAIADACWPLRDARRQALHDKPAKTVVVRA